MTKETVLQMMKRMIELQDEAIAKGGLSKENMFFREGVKSAYFHAIEWVKDIEESND